jgi:hypothetical protein
MLDHCSLIAHRMHWFYILGRPLIVLFFGVFVFEVFFDFNPRQADQFLIPSGVIALWLLVTTAFIGTFSSSPARRYWREGRIKWIANRAVRAYYYLLVILTLCLTLSSVFVTFRLMRIWL